MKEGHEYWNQMCQARPAYDPFWLTVISKYKEEYTYTTPIRKLKVLYFAWSKSFSCHDARKEVLFATQNLATFITFFYKGNQYYDASCQQSSFCVTYRLFDVLHKKNGLFVNLYPQKYK